MATLLIADRDNNERIGLEWLARSHPLPFETILTVENLPQLLLTLEQQTPDVLCLELDSISPEHWDGVRQAVKGFAKAIVAMTAEATFERAEQAIMLGAADLWIKPLDPARIPRVLSRLCRELSEQTPTTPTASTSGKSGYPALFLDSETLDEEHLLYLIQPETIERLPALVPLLEQHPFYQTPHILPLDDAIACLIPTRANSTESLLRQQGYRLLDSWAASTGDGLTVVIHLPAPTVTLRQQYLTARQALQWRFYRGTRQVISVTAPVRWQPLDPFLTPKEQQGWIEMLEQRDRVALGQWMHQEFLRLDPPFPDPGLLRTRLTSLLAQVRRYMQAGNLDKHPVFEERYHHIFDSILHGPVLYRIVQDLILFVEALFDAVAEEQQTTMDPAKQALQYMLAHYQDPWLSLEKVATHVQRNASYLSHLLSRTQGKPFRELLADIRLTQAKRLLETTPLSISEIANQTGFSNANYFSRLFKKQTGCSPRTYRDQK
ncbi:response regulator transcription factor [Marininema halotolerans]|uniref:Two-component response regulator, YesN/AraC family, consists of REC and AraC-type DNA-binding domains n=1 Tax=Marininema halotolerans TaxID=1155944 RepID=A0A1I6QMU2_9BACL|nr:response regulator transcription factor [Marininema halotolerans]SFS53759.1 Two-component response regulator, YesN/AraC family, consists of REC and AraC-type DNA-binding domains [Marininema halotolerans]